MVTLLAHLTYTDECVQFCQAYVPSRVLPRVLCTDSVGTGTLNKEVAGITIPRKQALV